MGIIRRMQDADMPMPLKKRKEADEAFERRKSIRLNLKM
jgi:hypothetical protein